MSGHLVVQRILDLPADLADLEAPSLEEGFGFIERLARDWTSGRNRFSQPGEAMFEARLDGRLVGVCGLSRDPYVDDPGIARLRHLYVLPERRRCGVGLSLVLAALERARGTYRLVRLRANDPAARRFYRSHGFTPTPDALEATHCLEAPFQLAASPRLSC